MNARNKFIRCRYTCSRTKCTRGIEARMWLGAQPWHRVNNENCRSCEREKKPFELSCKIPEATQHLPNPHAGNRNDEKNDRENAEAYVVPLKRAVIRARSRAEPSRPKITSNLVLNAKFATTTHRAKFPFSAAFSPNTNKWIGMKTHSTRLRPRLAGCVNCELCAICGSVIRHQLLVVSSFSAICHCRAYLTNFLFGDFVFSAHLRLTSRLWLFVVSHTRVRMPFVAESDGLFLANKKKLYEIMVDNKKKTRHTKNLWLIIRTTHDGWPCILQINSKTFTKAFFRSIHASWQLCVVAVRRYRHHDAGTEMWSIATCHENARSDSNKINK